MIFWSDPYISTQVLETHLDPKTDAGSRTPAVINREVAFIVDRVAQELGAGQDAPSDRTRPRTGRRRGVGSSRKRVDGLRLLDLGCGPGLYTQHFEQAGFWTTGVDFGPASVERARESVGDRTRILEMDYRKGLPSGPFDVAVLIYGGFCTLSPKERRLLLSNIAAALTPGGLFFFDAFTPHYLDLNSSVPEWEIAPEGGFFSKKGYICFEQVHRYTERLACEQYYLVDEEGDVAEYRNWHQAFSRETVRPALSRAGLVLLDCYNSLAGGPYDEFSDWFACVARRPKP